MHLFSKQRSRSTLAIAAASGLLIMSTVASAAPALASPAQGASVHIADPDATASTASLFRYLRDTSGTDILFGQQHATDYSISDPTGSIRSDVNAMTGDLPAVFGFDTFVIDGRELPGTGGASVEANAKKLADAFVAADSAGAIVTLSAHWSNPATGKDYNDTTQVVDRLLPGGDLQAKFDAELDKVARAAELAKRSDGTLVPIIFRPLHENTGNFFWWGTGHATAGEYKELFRYTVEYLRDKKGVHNLLYAYSPNGALGGDKDLYLATYPGDDFVDVLGYDYYDSADSENNQSWLNATVADLAMISTLAQDRGKLSAFTEFGRGGDKTIKRTGNKQLTWYTDLLTAIKSNAQASHISYMTTWANFGGSADNFQAYTPWPGHEMESDFQAFALDPKIVMASELKTANVFGLTTQAVQPDASIRVVSPADGVRVSNSPVTVRAKLTGAQSATQAWFTVDSDSTAYPLTLDSDGYLSADWTIDPALLDNKRHEVTVHADVAGTELSNSSFVVLGEKPVSARGVIDDFEAYSDSASLQSEYVFRNVSSAAWTLDTVSGSNAGTLAYDFTSLEYLGIGKSYKTAQNWSGFSELNMDLTSDGSDHKLVVQLTAGGITFEAYPSLATAGTATVSLALSDFAPAPWESAANKQATLTQERLARVTAFMLYLNDGDKEFTPDNRPRQGTLSFDNIAWAGTGEYVEPETPTEEIVEPAEHPFTVEDFESYDSDSALHEAWGNRGDTNLLQLSIDANQGKQAMQFSYDFDVNGGFIDVSRWVSGQDWSGQERLTFDLKGDGSKHQLGIQFRTAGDPEDNFFDFYIPIEGTEWTTISLPFSDAVKGWPDDADKGRAPRDSDLKKVNEVVFFISQQDSGIGTSGRILLDNIRADRADQETTEPTDPGTTEPTDPATTEPTDTATTEPTDPVTTEPTEPTDPSTTEPTDTATTTAAADDSDESAGNATADPGDENLASTGANGLLPALITALILFALAVPAWIVSKRNRT